MTQVWYAEVISRLEDGSKVLDIGIGTGTALVNNRAAVVKKRLTFVGVDYEPAYVDKCQRNAKAAQVQDNLSAICASVYDEHLGDLVGTGFDAVYFSGSISLMPDPVGALHATAKLLKKKGGVIYITQTFQRRGTFLLAWVKPMLK